MVKRNLLSAFFLWCIIIGAFLVCESIIDVGQANDEMWPLYPHYTLFSLFKYTHLSALIYFIVPYGCIFLFLSADELIENIVDYIWFNDINEDVLDEDF